ncbi:MAG: hypothetical protein FFODKBPE_00530 [Candidatus Argoarchaeum ethanivorans]|uniref:DUF2283 domain-containing protein n=1 Tax=Candidatus Argoarchaeum ethanivorans TaxID=2608793 RepID=A0A811TB94_9EURY|nr:MAG: hypothetical protein FFODKBPE_00530 [Candidatus Argoarchaeum ethanivorans]
MKISYNREDDILVYEVGEGKIDYAEEMGPIIVHFDKKGKPLLLEILDASEFITQTTKFSMKAIEGERTEIAA